MPKYTVYTVTESIHCITVEAAGPKDAARLAMQSTDRSAWTPVDKDCRMVDTVINDDTDEETTRNDLLFQIHDNHENVSDRFQEAIETGLFPKP